MPRLNGAEGVGDSFLATGLEGRLDALCQRREALPVPASASAGAWIGWRGTVRFVVAGTDPSRAAGAIGGADASALAVAVARARRESLPLVLLLDSGGALLTEGVAVLGGFRQLQRALLDASADGLPVLAVLGRHCFGGASLLAFSADARLYPEGCRLGLSGPRALQALTEVSSETLDAVYAPASRARHDTGALRVDDHPVAVVAAVEAWLSGDRTPADRSLAALTQRLRLYRGDPETLDTMVPSPDLQARLDLLFPQGWSAACGDGVVSGDARTGTGDLSFAGFVGGRPVSAFACWRMVDTLRRLDRDPGDQPVVLLLDSPGQAADLDAEQMLLSEFVTRVAEAAHQLGRHGRSVELWLVGQSGGAIYVALAAAASRVTAWPGVRVQTLPPRAVSGVLGAAPEPPPADLQALLGAGVIDHWAGRAPAPISPTRPPGVHTS